MAVELTVVGKVVLRRGHRLEISGVVAHQSPDERAGHHGGQERILAVRLARPSPPGVADRFHNGRPEGKSLGACLIDCPGLVGYRGCLPLEQVGIPAGSEGDAARIGGGTLEPYRGIGAGKHSVQSLAPQVVLAYGKPGHRRHIVSQKAFLLFQGQTGHKIHGPLLEGIVRILVDRCAVVSRERADQQVQQCQ